MKKLILGILLGFGLFPLCHIGYSIQINKYWQRRINLEKTGKLPSPKEDIVGIRFKWIYEQGIIGYFKFLDENPSFDDCYSKNTVICNYINKG